MDKNEAATIGHALLSDIDAVFPLLERFYREEGFNTGSAALRRNLMGMLEDPRCYVATAAKDGQAVGIATVSTTRSTEDGLLAEIQDLYVLPEHRGNGIARLLVDECLAWATVRGCSGVEVVITSEAEAQHRLSVFYRKLGFRATGRMIHSRPTAV